MIAKNVTCNQLFSKILVEFLQKLSGFRVSIATLKAFFSFALFLSSYCREEEEYATRHVKLHIFLAFIEESAFCCFSFSYKFLCIFKFIFRNQFLSFRCWCSNFADFILNFITFLLFFSLLPWFTDWLMSAAQIYTWLIWGYRSIAGREFGRAARMVLSKSTATGFAFLLRLNRAGNSQLVPHRLASSKLFLKKTI